MPLARWPAFGAGVVTGRELCLTCAFAVGGNATGCFTEGEPSDRTGVDLPPDPARCQTRFGCCAGVTRTALGAAGTTLPVTARDVRGGCAGTTGRAGCEPCEWCWCRTTGAVATTVVALTTATRTSVGLRTIRPLLLLISISASTLLHEYI